MHSTTHTHILPALLFAVVSYLGSFIVWHHLFAVTDTAITGGGSMLSLFGLFLIGYVVSYFHHLLNPGTNLGFPLVIWLLLIATVTIPLVVTHGVTDAVLMPSLIDTLVTAFLGSFVIGKTLPAHA